MSSFFFNSLSSDVSSDCFELSEDTQSVFLDFYDAYVEIDGEIVEITANENRENLGVIQKNSAKPVVSDEKRKVSITETRQDGVENGVKRVGTSKPLKLENDAKTRNVKKLTTRERFKQLTTVKICTNNSNNQQEPLVKQEKNQEKLEYIVQTKTDKKDIKKGKKESDCVNELPQNCSSSRITYYSGLDENMRISYMPLTFCCPQCAFTTKYRGELVKHRREHRENKDPLQCYRCAYKTTVERRLLEHNRYRHHDQKRYRCEQCGYCSCKMNYLKAHYLVHHRAN